MDRLWTHYGLISKNGPIWFPAGMDTVRNLYEGHAKEV